MLKNVVLPAPFGPIRLTIAPLRNREVDVVDGDEAAELLPQPWPRRAGRSIHRARLARRRGTASSTALFELGLAAGARDQPLGPEEHHEHEDQAEDAELVERHVDVRPEGLVDLGADVPEALLVQVGEEAAADDHAPDVAHPAEDDHAEDEDRDVEEEVVGERAALEARVVGAGDAAEERPGRVRPGLRPHQRHAHRGRGGLVLADRDPRAAEARVAKPHRAEDREEEEPERGPVEDLDAADLPPQEVGVEGQVVRR